ncbi:hypothetical protein FB45DRAFT_904764, partial [Roridomyces roridus]
MHAQVVLVLEDYRTPLDAIHRLFEASPDIAADQVPEPIFKKLPSLNPTTTTLFTLAKDVVSLQDIFDFADHENLVSGPWNQLTPLAPGVSWQSVENSCGCAHLVAVGKRKALDAFSETAHCVAERQRLEAANSIGLPPSDTHVNDFQSRQTDPKTRVLNGSHLPRALPSLGLPLLASPETAHCVTERQRLEVAKSIGLPLSDMHVDAFQSRQTDPKTRVLNGRHLPGALPPLGLPLTLFSRAFSHFVANTKYDTPVDIKTLGDERQRGTLMEHVQQLLTAGGAMYTEEALRTSAISGPLNNILGRMFGKTRQLSMKHDEVKPHIDVIKPLLTDMEEDMEAIYNLAYREDINEKGLGGRDVIWGAMGSYIAFWPYDDFAQLNLRCSRPAFLLTVQGPTLTIHGAAFPGDWITQEFACINLQHDRLLDTKSVLRTAHVLKTLKESIRLLDKEYENWAKVPVIHPGDMDSRAPQGAKYYPQCLVFQGVDDEPRKLVFRGPLSKNNTPAQASIFRASCGDQAVIVKFAETCGEDVHRLLARADLAPKLLYCGHPFADLDIGVKMVVMEELHFNFRPVDVPTVPQCDQLDAVLRILRENGCVHGDLRPRNIMVHGSSVRVVDFAWAGKVGEVHYPYNLYRDTGFPAMGSSFGMKEIAMEDDVRIMQQILSQASNKSKRSLEDDTEHLAKRARN